MPRLLKLHHGTASDEDRNILLGSKMARAVLPMEDLEHPLPLGFA